MDRRNFFKMVAGFVAGVYAVFTPKAKAGKPLTSAAPSADAELKHKCQINLFRFEGKNATDYCNEALRVLQTEPEVSTDELNDMMAAWMAKQKIRATERMNHPAYIIDKNGFVNLLMV